MENKIAAAAIWLRESDILNKDENGPGCGGVNNGYLWKEKRYQYIYNEITGYSINSFLSINKWYDDPKWVRHAENSANYLIRQQSIDDASTECGAVSHSLAIPDFKVVPKYYTFDNAVILHGMVNLYLLTQKSQYHESCQKIANWLLSMQKPDGSFYSFYDAEMNTIQHPYDEFFYDSGCLHVKNAIGLMHMSTIVDNDAFFKAALRVCDWGKQLMDRDGFFWANINKKYYFTHAHCYATEGYIWAFHFSKQEDYLSVAIRAADALLDRQNPDGSVYRIYKPGLLMKRWFGNKYRPSLRLWWNEKKHPWKTTDATAQSARIWSLLYTITGKEKYFDAATHAIAFIEQMQVLDSEDKNMNGGFYYQICDVDHQAQHIVNGGMYTWCTQFGLSAFMLFELARKNKPISEMIHLLF